MIQLSICHVRFLGQNFKKRTFVKFRYCEKATKFDKISHFLFKLRTKQSGRFFQICMAFSEYLNLTKCLENMTEVHFFTFSGKLISSHGTRIWNLHYKICLPIRAGSDPSHNAGEPACKRTRGLHKLLADRLTLF